MRAVRQWVPPALSRISSSVWMGVGGRVVSRAEALYLETRGQGKELAGFPHPSTTVLL